MEDKLKKLEDLIELYKSNSITKEEYDLLKNELLIDSNTKVEVDNNYTKPIIEKRIPEEIKTQNNYQDEDYHEETFYEANKGIIYTIIVFICIALFFLKLNNNKDQETVVEESNSNTTYEQPIKVEPEQKQCYLCKGTGMVTCSMCDGTGINNMGIDCSCETYNRTMIQMGRETSPYQGRVHRCIHCKGTGYVD